MMTDIYYGCNDPWGEFYDLQHSNRDKVIEWIDDHHAQQCEEVEGLRNGQTIESTYEILTYKFDEETDEITIISTEEYEAEWEYYHGDFEEHNTLWNCL